MAEQINIIIAEDQHLLRQTLTSMLDEVDDFQVSYDVSDGKSLLAFLKDAPTLPYILLLDISLPDINGLELCPIITRDFPHVRIIVVSIHQQESLIARMITLGASAYLNKNVDFDLLVQAIRAVYAHKFFMDDHVIKILQNSQRHLINEKKKNNQIDIDLSIREIEVLTLICREMNSMEIADRLFISARTVDGHRNRMLLKTKSKNVAGLVMFAIKHNLVELI
ncbi:response regulator transcription factor [Mucilaginibacter jinjuensis]|uniref:Response regulator transcription factor n=1 Tax=Mucilaginibacter jinjuensis TaxID=1176721 RepID=A0ABY7TD81_9SPHI|nr:response regulator transcription factor [Mucilaginibacter jinjuensis]WCT14416.1 response regulator transcription factor [Mucilaginibacter jinjuensis]